MDSPGSSNLPKSGLKPTVAEMVNNSIATLKERNGSSLYAIKKQISNVYPVDVEKLAPFIKKYLNKAVLDGTLIQTSGRGATGSFKLSKIVKEKKDKKHVEKINKPTQKQVAEKATTPVKTTKSKIEVHLKVKKTVVKKVSPEKVTSKGISEKKIAVKRIAEKKVTQKVVTRINESPIEKKSTVRAKPVKSSKNTNTKLSKTVAAK